MELQMALLELEAFYFSSADIYKKHIPIPKRNGTYACSIQNWKYNLKLVFCDSIKGLK